MDTGTFIAIDTETTGLSFTDDRVIQFGCAIFIKGKMVDQGGWYIYTNRINGGAFVNQIPQYEIEDGRDHNWSWAIISKLLKKGIPICAYNAPFDLTFIAHELARHNIDYNFANLRVIDPLVIERHYKPFLTKPAYRLGPTSKRYSIPWDGMAHDAIADAVVAGHVWLAQKHHRSIRRTSLELHRATVQWHNEWRMGFENWALKHNKEVKVIDWPLDKDMVCFPVKEQSSLHW